MNFEQGIVGCFLYDDLDVGKILEKAKERGLKPEYFKDNQANAAYQAILRTGSTDSWQLQDAVRCACGQSYLESAIENAPKISIEAIDRIRKFINESQKCEIDACLCRIQTLRQRVAASIDYKNLLRDGLDAVERQLLQDGAEDPYKTITFADLPDPVPDDENPDALIRNGWLRRGQLAVLVSYSGSGKSVIANQLGYAFSRGVAALGIRPVRPLRVGILQYEDDIGEMSMFRANCRRGYQEIEHWTEADIVEAEKNLILPESFPKPSGDEFIFYLRNFQRREKCDLIVINPFLSAYGGSIIDNEKIGRFLRKGIQSVLDSKEDRCGILLIHHTNKPSNDPRDAGGFGSDRFAEYAGAGGAEITNYARAILVIKPTRDPNEFDLIAAKHGDRLEWPRKADDKAPKPHRKIRHSTDGLIFWLDGEVDQGGEKPDTGNRRPKNELQDDVTTLANALKETAQSLTDARKKAYKLLQTHKRAEAAYREVRRNPKGSGLVIERTDVTTKQFIGSQEGVKNAILKMAEERK